MNISGDSVKRIGESIGHFIRQYHVAFYTLTVVIGVSVAMFLLNNILSLSNISNQTPATSSIFTGEVVERIRGFNTSTSIQNTLKLPEGRINPFMYENTSG